jgi:hypothetical protein
MKLALALLLISLTVFGKNLQIDKLELGGKLDLNKYGAPYKCVVQDDKTKDACFMNNCPIGSEKCLLWGKKSLPLRSSDVLMTKKKITKVYMVFDYDDMKAFEARKVLEDLTALLGKPSECPMESSLKDSMLLGEFYCAWKGKGEIIRLYPEGNKLTLKLESE